MAERYPGGYITKTPPAPTSTAAPGVWTLEQAMQNVKAGTWPPNGPYFIEEVFSTYLYNGSGTGSQTIVNNINLSGKGGMVWGKVRTNVDNNYIFDTVRGIGNGLNSNTTDAQGDPGISAFNNNGFDVDSNLDSTNSARTFVTWTFREQPKFFDVVTYNGNGSTQAINHNLGSSPGMVIVKWSSGTSVASADWYVWHRSLTSGYYIKLNATNPESNASAANFFGNNTTTVDPTSTTFTVGNHARVNQSGSTYVAYIFAHNAGGFGTSGSDNVITCGVVSGDATVDLGYEPQWLLFKAKNQTDNWYIIDNMRGFISGTSSNQRILYPNLASAEANLSGVGITSTGFVTSGYTGYDNIYIAIRRGPMKTPTSGTSVYTPIARSGTGTNATISAGFVVDWWHCFNRGSGSAQSISDRLRGSSNRFETDSAAAEDGTGTSVIFSSNQLGIVTSTLTGVYYNASGNTYVDHLFSRAPGFFDVVCYTGTGSATTVTHNLKVAPELMIVKNRSTVNNWIVYSATLGNTGFLGLNTTNGDGGPSTSVWNSTSPTSSVFSVGTASSTNGNGNNMVAYLFASVSGVSKVGSYTGTGTTLQVNCGFTNGSRFVLIKRTDSTGDWYVWDSARGIVAGNDPYLLLNSSAAEVTNTDYVDTYSAGFEISSTAPAAINANGGTFIFLAIA